MRSSRYSIAVDPLAAKDLSLLRRSDRALSRRIVEAIDELGRDPFSGKPLRGDKKGCYSLRCGDWRIIYEVYRAEGVVHIVRVGHRRDVYR